MLSVVTQLPFHLTVLTSISFHFDKWYATPLAPMIFPLNSIHADEMSFTNSHIVSMS